MAHDFGFEPALDDYYFVSYCGRYPDTLNRTKNICAELHELNVPLWYDRAIPMGTKYATEISKRIEGCKCMLLFISSELLYNPEGDQDSYVLVEFDIARRKRKTIIPVFLDSIDGTKVNADFDEFYSLAKKLQGVSVTSGTPSADAAKKICGRLGIEYGGPVSRPAPQQEKDDGHSSGGNYETVAKTDRGPYTFAIEKYKKSSSNGNFTIEIRLVRISGGARAVMMKRSYYYSPLFHNSVSYRISFDEKSGHLILEQSHIDSYVKELEYSRYEYSDPFGDCTKFVITENKDIDLTEQFDRSYINLPIHISL